MFKVSDIFGGSKPQEQVPQQQGQQGQQQTQQQSVPGNIPNKDLSKNPSDPNNQNQNNDQNNNDDSSTIKNPLDTFSDLWKNDASAENQQNTSMFNVDPQKLAEAAGKIDFTKVIGQDTIQTMAKGGEEGVAASMQAMNKIVQTVYAQSALATTKIVEQAVNKAQEKFNSEIPTLIKKHSVNSSLRKENPAFSHPAVQPLISALESQLAVKFPNATDTELTDMAKQYLEASMGQLVPAKKEEPGPKGKNKKQETDWSDFLAMD